MRIKRRKTKKIFVKDITIGGASPIVIQSMTNTDTVNIAKTLKQIKRLEQAGCQIVRVAVLNEQAAGAISKIKQRINIPLVADIHFDYRLAIASIKHGADKIRLNPGNICKRAHIEKIINEAKKNKIPIRIGLNSGSVKRTAKNSLVDDMINAGRDYLNIFKENDYDQVIFSLKTHDVLTTIEAYRRMAKLTEAPMHLGITASGLPETGIIKSSIGLGVLLLEGIGDTIRVSLTADPVEEVKVAKKILSALRLGEFGIEIISCPSCGRCTIDLISIVRKVEEKLSILDNKQCRKKIEVAVMGCMVNGPGEAKDADIGIAWGGKSGLLFRKGKKVSLVKQNELISTLIAEVRNEII